MIREIAADPLDRRRFPADPWRLVEVEYREGDVGAILGWGFMPWSGGPFGWLDILGAGPAVALADRLAADHGPRFAPPALLRRMAAEGDRFYPSPAATGLVCPLRGSL